MSWLVREVVKFFKGKEYFGLIVCTVYSDFADVKLKYEKQVC